MATKQDSIAEILRTALFGENKKTGKRTTPIQEKLSGSSVDPSQISLLRAISTNARISAKNSMALPSILQQTNIMQKNIAKLVRLQGSAPSNKSDAFFSSSKFRENAYEATFRKNNGPTTSPTPDKPVQKKSLMDLFGSMFGIFKSVFNVDFLKKVLIGGAVIGGLTKYFGDPEFRKQVNEMLDKFRKALITDEAWEKLKSGFTKVGLGALALYAALKYVTFKLNTMAISNAIGGCGCGGPIIPGGTRGPGGRSGKKGQPRDSKGRYTKTPAPAPGRPRIPGGVGTVLNAATLAGLGYSMMSSGSEDISSIGESTEPGTSPQAESGPNYTSIGINTLFAATTVGSLAYNAGVVKRYLAGGGDRIQKLAKTGRASSIISRLKNLFTVARAKSWGPRFTEKTAKRLGASAVGKRILAKVMTAIVGAFVPGPGWVAAVLSFVMIAADLYFLYTIVSDVYDELVREDSGGATPTSTEEKSTATPTAFDKSKEIVYDALALSYGLPTYLLRQTYKAASGSPSTAPSRTPVAGAGAKPQYPSAFTPKGDYKFVDSSKPVSSSTRYSVSGTQDAKTFENIVLHDSDAETAAATIKYGHTFDAKRAKPGFYGYHFVIDRDGTVHQAAPLNARTNHLNSDLTPKGWSNANSIGIAMASKGQGNYTQAQIAAAEKLVQDLGTQFGIPSSNITTHGKLQRDKQPTEAQIPYEAAMKNYKDPTASPAASTPGSVAGAPPSAPAGTPTPRLKMSPIKDAKGYIPPAAAEKQAYIENNTFNNIAAATSAGEVQRPFMPDVLNRELYGLLLGRSVAPMTFIG